MQYKGCRTKDEGRAFFTTANRGLQRCCLGCNTNASTYDLKYVIQVNSAVYCSPWFRRNVIYLVPVYPERILYNTGFGDSNEQQQYVVYSGSQRK